MTDCKIIEGKVRIHEWEGGFSASSLSIGDIDDFVMWFAQQYGDAVTCRAGAPDQKINGSFKITVEMM